MADSITWLVNADASQIRAEMNSAMQSANRGTDAIVQGFNRADLAHGTLLKSNQRVANQIGHFAQAAMTGADSITLMGTAMEGLAHATKLPLGALTALIAGGMFVFKLHEVNKEFNELAKQQDEIIKKDLTKEKIDQLEALKVKAVEVAKQMDEQEKSFLGSTLNVIKGNGKRGLGPNRGELANTAMTGAVREAGGDTWSMSREKIIKGHEEAAEAYHKRRLADIPREVDEEIAKRKHEGLIEAEAGKFKSGLQLSLADYAKGGREWAPGGGGWGEDSIHSPYRNDMRSQAAPGGGFTPGSGRIARQAMREEELAKKAMLNDDYTGAIKHQSIAEQLKAMIPGLKDSDKIPGLLTIGNGFLREIAQKVTFERVR
jgi:hypothetical protein